VAVTSQTPAEPTRAARVLIVDDDPDMRDLLGHWLRAEGLTVEVASSGVEALARLDVERPDLVLTDLFMDDMDGLRLIAEVHRDDPILPVIMLSGQAEVGDALKAAHLGVSAFLTKPVQSDALLDAVTGALERAGHRRDQAAEEFAPQIVHESTVMSVLLERARRVALSDSTVLITGNTGTGKELLARAIHEASDRAGEPFVTINCSAIPDQLLESELFGHEKGAFTGATARHEGLFVAANGGSLFLDEIGEMPLQLQAKVLRVLQDFQVRPVGSVESTPVDVRVISATNRDLQTRVKSGDFREDLFYRLSVVPLHIPDLDARREDISPIVERLLDMLAERRGGSRKRFTRKALDVLTASSWPGNVRQLANVVEHCCVLSATDLIPVELVREAAADAPQDVLPLDEARRIFERRYLVSVLRVSEGNVSTAARMAGRNRTEFYRLLTKHELDPAVFRKSQDA
jgi:two-component system response regulator GlrR